jgi:carboxymethylenebutenolidase
MPNISFKRPDGKSTDGFYAEPAGGLQAPGIVVIQEWWGLNDQIKGVANKLAGAGYRALVPDLYRGKVTLEAQEAQHLMSNLNFGDAAGQDIRGAVQYLKESSARVGITGFCMGGALTLLGAVNVPEADAAAAWYGFPPLEYIDATKIKMPLLGHFCVNDAHFPIASVAELEKKLKAAGVKFEFYRYNANHAFCNENGPAYDREAAELAWQRTMEFFAKTLR